MRLLCDRCTREIEAIGDVPVPPRAEDIVISDLPSVPLRDYRRLPKDAAVYFAVSDERVCYIGEGRDIHYRWRHHGIFPRLAAEASPRIAWCLVRDTKQRKNLERDSIKRFRPLWNRGGAEHMCFQDSNARWPKITGGGRDRAERIRQVLHAGGLSTASFCGDS